MGYGEDALDLRKPRLIDLPRSGDRISFLHVDHSKVWQDDTGVVARNDHGEDLRIPVGSLSLLSLGNGVSISTPALATLARAGCTVMVTTDGGAACITEARPLAARAKWAEAQARMWARKTNRVAAARVLYADRYPDINWASKGSLTAMRGVEGHRVKLAYSQAAAEHGFPDWKRETRERLISDPVNPLLNLANSILYGAARAAVAAVALNPALGIVHQGSTSALLFDLADAHKANASIPLAFACARTENPALELRRRLRRYLHKMKVLEHNLRLLDAVLGPHFDDAAEDDTLLGEHVNARGHTNYAKDAPRDVRSLPGLEPGREEI